MTEVKERKIDLIVEEITITEEDEGSKLKEEDKKKKKRSFWDYFGRYPYITHFFGY
ncbi:MAG: hypothetical protein ACFE8A_12055 [Candidatus Hodarchaeota archaeon]